MDVIVDKGLMSGEKGLVIDTPDHLLVLCHL